MGNIKYAVISYPDSYNRGDEVQSLAAANLLPKVDYYVPRNEIHTFKPQEGEKVKLICNGWFSMTPEAWPPSQHLDPLFISFHITDQNDSKKQLLKKDLLDYYKRYEPIGARDKETTLDFQNIGVKSYFSGCLTLTLDNPYTEDQRTDEIILLDPFYMFNYDQDYIKDCLDILVPKAYREKVVILTNKIYKHEEKQTIEEKFEAARQLLNRLARAKFVITSRIHCALPCLAFNTPVYFTDIGYNTTAARNRFDGIIDLFNTIGDEYFPMPQNKLLFYPLRKLKLYKLIKQKNLKIPIDWENPAPNKNRHIPIREGLIKKVNSFIETP